VGDIHETSTDAARRSRVPLRPILASGQLSLLELLGAELATAVIWAQPFAGPSAAAPRSGTTTLRLRTIAVFATAGVLVPRDLFLIVQAPRARIRPARRMQVRACSSTRARRSTPRSASGRSTPRATA